jgi:hypothetical protein
VIVSVLIVETLEDYHEKEVTEENGFLDSV